jgi:hypothetical protein
LVCTLDACVEAPGDCLGNYAAPCCFTDIPDCVENPDLTLKPRGKQAPTCSISGAVCSNVGDDCAPGEGVCTEDAATCADDGDKILVDVLFGGTPSTLVIAGASFRVEYDPSCLDFQSITAAPLVACNVLADCQTAALAPYNFTTCETLTPGPLGTYCAGGSPWTMEIFEQVDEVAGVIFYAVGVQVVPGGCGVVDCTKGSFLPGAFATISFTKIGFCNECELCFDNENPQHTYMTTTKGDQVHPAEKGCSKTIADNGPISINCPGDAAVNADCHQSTASVSWPTVTASDECDGDVPVTCTCEHTSLNPQWKCFVSGAQTLIPCPSTACDAAGGTCVDVAVVPDCDGFALSGGNLPQGHYEFSCSATDDLCKETATCTWTVEVSDQNSLNVELQLSPIVSGYQFQRCICYEFWASCAPQVMEEVCETVTFVGPFNQVGHGTDGVKVPKGANYECLTARDRQHSLRATYFPLLCDPVTHKYDAVFKGDPFFGGNWLIQGNINRKDGDSDRLIDILDFGTFIGQLNNNPMPGKNKTCEASPNPGAIHADLNGDGIVDVADYTFIANNFLENDKDKCCPDDGVASVPQGRTEISVDELRTLGMEDLIIADLNSDGLVNTADMEAFLTGARPAAPKSSGRGDAPQRARR